MNQLTNTETRVVHCISQGFVFKEIANMMFVSTHTVHTHARNIRKKWNARNIADMTRIYILSLEDPKLVMKAMLCLLIHIGASAFESDSDLRKPSKSKIVKTIKNLRTKTNTDIYYA